MNEELNVLTAKDLQVILNVGRNRAYELMNSSCFPSIRINKRLFVTRKALQKWLDSIENTVYRI